MRETRRVSAAERERYLEKGKSLMREQIDIIMNWEIAGFNPSEMLLFLTEDEAEAISFFIARETTRTFEQMLYGIEPLTYEVEQIQTGDSLLGVPVVIAAKEEVADARGRSS